nr:putative reverse transcriptase domain-containing protein [Tanacetum cinerariifolium]
NGYCKNHEKRAKNWAITDTRTKRIKDRLKAARDRQKSYADKRRKPLKFSVGNYVLLKVSPWKGVVRFGKKGKLAPRFVGLFEIVEKVGPVAYRLDMPEELNVVHDTFHVSNLKKCLADLTLQVHLDEIRVDAKLNFMEEPVEILEREFKKLKRSRIAIVKVRWNSKRGPEFTWEREDQIFNTIITSLKALDESFSSRNHVRKFLRALPSKWRPKVTAIKESKDLSKLSLNELVGNLKVYEVVLEKDLESAKNKKEKYKSLALKLRQVLSDKDACSSDSNDEEYALAVRDFKKFFKRRGKFIRQPYDDKKNFRKAKEDKKEDRRCFKCGDPNHFISDCPKNSFNDQKAFVVGC